MALNLKFGQSDKKKTVQSKNGKASKGLESLFRGEIRLEPEKRDGLKSAFEKGLEHFHTINNSRMELAFSSFDESMKLALYEIIYLLHVNDPALEEVRFSTKVIQDYKETTVEHCFNLYVENAPCGVAGIDNIPELYQEQFEEHVLATFEQKQIPSAESCHITGIFSIGSIGTIGHKHLTSDLDLEVLYRLHPFSADTGEWSDKVFLDALQKEVRYYMKQIQKQQGIASDKRINDNLKNKLKKAAFEQVQKNYPYLYSHLLTKQKNVLKMIAGSSRPQLKEKVIEEIIELMQRQVLHSAESPKSREALLKKKIAQIQEYIEIRYPEAEIYLFPLSEEDMKKGYFGSTLDSKESSGSAYEKIMTFDTLMPGIYYTPTIPAHFIFPDQVNNDKDYKKILNYIRFNLLDSVYGPVKNSIMDQGPTVDLDTKYIGNHLGAVYWEAFKASSGNLPKALLNLFRYEMLFDSHISKTVIQLLKNPKAINGFVVDEADSQIPIQNRDYLPGWQILQIEQRFPLLSYDPWWLRYKALKIGYGEKGNISGIDPDEQRRISSVLDLAFALHIRISDVFTKPGSTRSFELHREQVLLEFFESAFPPETAKRKQIEQIFIGEISAVNHFEAEMRKLFKRSIKRVRQKVKQLGIDDAINTKQEYKIWFHYYEKNFEFKATEIHQSILNHLKVPRGRVQIGFDIKSGWFFKSLQKESSIGKRFDTFSILDQLPPKIGLIENVPFLFGLASCVFNGYYGILNKGTLKEEMTSLEFDAKHTDLGNKIDNTFAYIHPGQVEKMMSRIIEFFPYKKVDHRECLRGGTKITDLMVFLNLIKFGRISFLFRNNLGSVFCVEKNHPDLFNNARKMSTAFDGLIHSKLISNSLSEMLADNQIDIKAVNLGVWVNANSFDTKHSVQNAASKEEELESKFKQQIESLQLDEQKPQLHEGQGPQTTDKLEQRKSAVIKTRINQFSAQLPDTQKIELKHILSTILKTEGHFTISESFNFETLINSLS